MLWTSLWRHCPFVSQILLQVLLFYLQKIYQMISSSSVIPYLELQLTAITHLCTVAMPTNHKINWTLLLSLRSGWSYHPCVGNPDLCSSFPVCSMCEQRKQTQTKAWATSKPSNSERMVTHTWGSGHSSHQKLCKAHLPMPLWLLVF